MPNNPYEDLDRQLDEDEIFVSNRLDVDDSSFTFRVSSTLKAEFQSLVKKDRYSAASVLKRYMLKCVRENNIRT